MTEPVHHGWLYRRFLLPVLALLRMGATPETLAWSLAAGLLVGINPLLGSTTFVCLGVAFAFRLNVAASQLANHLVYPLEILLVLPFIRLGSRLFTPRRCRCRPPACSTPRAPIPSRSPASFGCGSGTPLPSGPRSRSSPRQCWRSALPRSSAACCCALNATNTP